MKTIMTFSALVSLLVIAPIAYMLADNEAPYVYDAADSYVIPQTMQAGTQVTVHWSLKVNRVCPGLITRNIVDVKSGVRTTYDPTPAAMSPEVGDRVLNRTFFLPAGITPGPKIYYADGMYGCNFLQRLWNPLIVRTPPLVFEILPPNHTGASPDVENDTITGAGGTAR